jgi:hypothetical protein
MFGLSAAVLVYLATKPAALRKSIDGLAVTKGTLRIDEVRYANW